MEVQELKDKLKNKFKRIWRCADSNKWYILKKTDLLTFDWIDKNTNYKSLSANEIGAGKRAIYPFVNSLKIGDLIFVMGKNSFQGIAICESEYQFNGFTLNMGDSGDKPAVKVNYLFKSENSVNHNLETHNNPTTFADINKYNFGLDNVLKFLKTSIPDAYASLFNYVNSTKINYKEQYTTWLNSTNKEGSKKAGSYIRAIEILSEITGKEIFEEDNLTVLNALYQDLLNEQEKADGKYYYEQAPSYGASRFYSAAINSYSDFITQLPKTQIAKTLLTPNMPLNSILYGPPGTGKTYNTINKAIAIANPTFDLSQNRTEVKKEFDRLMKEGQIVFTTFHQSMNYEDFIEGIKPIEPEKEGDPINYQIEYGIFRNLCIEASFSIAQLREDKTTEEVLDFSILYDKFAESVEEKLLNGEQVELETKTGGTVLVESISQQGNFVIKHHDGTRSYTVSKTRLTKLQSAIKNLDDVSNINDQFREVIGGSNSSAYWSVLNAIRKEKHTQPTNKESRTYTFSDKKDVVLSLTKSDYINKNGKPFVLIIDEINRGNVSQIFGELITLIEDDKRLGKDEALEVTLPYSKEKFGVPPNLFIIGTMNTADRSVEALDTALRRRFNFEEMPPKPELIKREGKLKNGVLENIELDLLLNTINKRIEKLLDKDHQIGHSYFISVADFTDLKSVFKNKIVPLLQEYFFGDYGKIGLVIGKGFFEPIDNDENIFADFDDYDTSNFAERNIYRIKDISQMDERVFINAIGTLMKK